MHHPYHHQSSDPTVVPDLDPEAVIARQEAMIKAGTHAMIAERLARDAVCNQTLRDRLIKPAIAPEIAPIIPETVV